jgi:hypothetical protein
LKLRRVETRTSTDLSSFRDQVADMSEVHRIGVRLLRGSSPIEKNRNCEIWDEIGVLEWARVARPRRCRVPCAIAIAELNPWRTGLLSAALLVDPSSFFRSLSTRDTSPCLLLPVSVISAWRRPAEPDRCNFQCPSRLWDSMGLVQDWLRWLSGTWNMECVTQQGEVTRACMDGCR